MRKQFALWPGVLTLLLFGVTLRAETLTFTSTDGAIYRNAVVEGVNPGGIDIGYINAEGKYVLRGLEFSELPADLQTKFGYDPETQRKYTRKIKKYSGKTISGITAAEQERITRTVKNIKDKFAGKDVDVKSADLEFAVRAARSSVELQAIAHTAKGTVADVVKHYGGGKIEKKRILLDSVKLPLQGTWTGFVYPSGLKGVYRKDELMVYSDNFERSAELLQDYMDIFCNYTLAGSPATPETETQQPPDLSVTSYGGDVRSVGSNRIPDYYIGSYGPYYWWWSCRPYPPRPPKPPKPPRPEPPPRPQPVPRPRSGGIVDVYTTKDITGRPIEPKYDRLNSEMRTFNAGNTSVQSFGSFRQTQPVRRAPQWRSR